VSEITTKRIESLARRIKVLEETVNACKDTLERQQPIQVEYVYKFSELMQASTELDGSLTSISAKRLDEQKLYISALDTINKVEREKESLNQCLVQNQSRLTVFSDIPCTKMCVS
jgi:chromosome segregation ATPase